MQHTSQNSSQQAFSLIELLTVVAVISLLLSMVLASLSSVRQQAQISQMVNELELIESSMAAWVSAGRTVEWPEEGEGDLSGMNNPNINDLREDTDLSQYLNSVSEPPYGSSYQYDNDGDTKSNCDSITAGVNIIVSGISEDIARELDSEIDDSVDLDCGNLQWRSRDSNPDQIFYVFSQDGNI